MKKLKIASEAGWVLAGQTSFLIGSLLSIKFLTEKLTPSIFGQLALGLTIAQGFVIIFFGPKSNGIARYLTISSKTGIADYYFKATNKVLINSSKKAAALGALASIIIWLIVSSESGLLVMYATTFAVTSGYVSGLISLLTAARKRTVVALHQGVEPWIKVTIAIFFITTLKAEANIVLAGYTVACLIMIVVLLIVIKIEVQRNGIIFNKINNEDWVSKINEYSNSFAMFAVFTWAYMASDRWAINHFTTLNDVGVYAVAFMLGYSPMIAISNALAQYATPIIYQKFDPSKSMSQHNARNATNILVVILIILSISSFLTTLIFGQFIVSNFASEEFVKAKEIVPWLALAGGLFVAGEAKAILFNATMNQSLQIKPKIFTALIGIALNIIGAMFWSSEGVAYSCVIFSVVYFTWISLLANKLNNKRK